MRTVVAVVSLVAVGCADPAPPTPQYVTVTEDNGEYTVSAPDYQMRFSPSGVKLPTSLLIDQAEEALASKGCPNESLVGTALFPVVVAAGGVTGTSDLVVDFAGPAVARLRVTYSVPYCTANNQALSGESTFTFFPSGRIVRHDTAKSSNWDLTSIPNCGCGNSSLGNMYFTSFWRFRTTTLVGADGAPIADNASATQGCVAGNNYTLGFAWSRDMTRARRDADSVSTTYDFAADVVSLKVYEAQVTSSIQIRGGVPIAQCPTVLADLAEDAITVDNTRVNTDANGVYVDEIPHAGSFDILARDGTVPPFAAVFTLPGAEHARVSQPEGTYAIQRYPGAADTFLFWFERGLGTGDRITIEPY